MSRACYNPNSRIAYSPARRAPPQQHAREYAVRRFQAPNSPTACAGVRCSHASSPRLPNCAPPRAAGPSPAARVGVRASHVSSPKLENCVLPRAAGLSPHARAREYAVRTFQEFQAPNSRIVYSPARRAPPQPHAREYAVRTIQAPNSRIVYPLAPSSAKAVLYGHLNAVLHVCFHTAYLASAKAFLQLYASSARFVCTARRSVSGCTAKFRSLTA